MLPYTSDLYSDLNNAHPHPTSTTVRVAVCAHNKTMKPSSEARAKRNLKRRQHDAAHRDDINEQKRQYRAARRDDINEQQRQYRAAHRDDINEQLRQYRAAVSAFLNFMMSSALLLHPATIFHQTPLLFCFNTVTPLMHETCSAATRQSVGKIVRDSQEWEWLHIFGTQQIVFVRMLYDNVEMDDLMTDDEVRIGCFGSDASNEDV